jgi:hypothetical protein
MTLQRIPTTTTAVPSTTSLPSPPTTAPPHTTQTLLSTATVTATTATPTNYDRAILDLAPQTPQTHDDYSGDEEEAEEDEDIGEEECSKRIRLWRPHPE